MDTKYTKGPWHLCRHLESLEADAACPCGYRGGIYSSDETHMICEMGSTEVRGEEGLEAPRYPRAVELANAHLISLAPDHALVLAAVCRGDLMVTRSEGDRVRVYPFQSPTVAMTLSLDAFVCPVVTAELRKVLEGT